MEGCERCESHKDYRTGVSHVGCVYVVQAVLELLGYGRCQSY